MLKKLFIAGSIVGALATGFYFDSIKINTINGIVSHMPTVKELGQTKLKYKDDFLEVYWSEKTKSAFACYFDGKTWRDLQSGYEI